MKINKTEFYTILDSGTGSISLTKEEAKKLYDELHKEFGGKPSEPPSIVFPGPKNTYNILYS